MRGKVYVGTSLHNSKRANELQKRFLDAGCVITYDWTTHGQVHSDDDLCKCGIAEERGVEDADVFFMISPARNGSHCELGLARGFGVKIVLLIEENQEKKTFYYLPEIKNRPEITRFTSEDEAVNYTLDFLDTKYERSNPKSH